MNSNKIRNRRFSLLLLFVVGLVWLSVPGQFAAAKDHARADIQARDIRGNLFTTESLKGKIVLLDFWATWCPPCVRAIPTLSRLHEDNRDRGFTVVGIASQSGSGRSVKKFLQDYEVSYPIVLGNDDLIERFGIFGFPTYILLDAEGQIVKQYSGGVADLYLTIQSDIDAIRKRTKGLG